MQRAASTGVLQVEPFLHFDDGVAYNPLTDTFLRDGEAGYRELRALALGERTPEDLDSLQLGNLARGRWLIEADGDPSRRFLLKYVALEAATACNQSCYFCPVSVAPRPDHVMPMELYESIAAQLQQFRSTLVGVSMINYNEPTADRRFVDQVAMLRRYQLPPAVLTNATGLTPKRVDQVLELGGLSYLSVNLSTLDRERYRRDRGGDHLPLVLRNLEYLKQRRIAPTMEIAVLGTGDDAHRQAFAEISDEYSGTCFDVKYYQVMDRAGAVAVGLRPPAPIRALAGCEQTGSRPLQWLHISPQGKCLLCCQDYHESYVVGDLTRQSLVEVLVSPEFGKMRRWAYGLEEAPEDFICRHCIYARRRDRHG
jgi:MoaA/NifB/PqqE/SkfB family radical SAM enzyme